MLRTCVPPKQTTSPTKFFDLANKDQETGDEDTDPAFGDQAEPKWLREIMIAAQMSDEHIIRSAAEWQESTGCTESDLAEGEAAFADLVDFLCARKYEARRLQRVLARRNAPSACSGGDRGCGGHRRITPELRAVLERRRAMVENLAPPSLELAELNTLIAEARVFDEDDDERPLSVVASSIGLGSMFSAQQDMDTDQAPVLSSMLSTPGPLARADADLIWLLPVGSQDAVMDADCAFDSEPQFSVNVDPAIRKDSSYPSYEEFLSPTQILFTTLWKR